MHDECEICGFQYKDRETAAECEQFCREHNACNPAIIAKAVDAGTDE